MKTLLASLAAVAVIAPGASATPATPAQPSPRTPVVVVREPQSGFDWSDALIGAGVASGLGLVLAGGALVRTAGRAGPAR
jgi:hypothetical protein